MTRRSMFRLILAIRFLAAGFPFCYRWLITKRNKSFTWDMGPIERDMYEIGRRITAAVWAAYGEPGMAQILGDVAMLRGTSFSGGRYISEPFIYNTIPKC